MSSIQIKEFSREFYEKEKDGKIVSGGYKNEVGPGTIDVPPKIKEAVERGDFRITDSYPPQGGEFALIGREINDKYSVLAVATSLTEDGSRPGVCYRYFWLEKHQNEDIDGIGTLLIWWEKVGKPKFEFNWQPTNSKLIYTTCTYRRDYFHQFRSQVDNLLNKQDTQSVFVAKKNGEIRPSYKGLHYLALYLNSNYSNAPIAWAWNVRDLDKIERFTLICLADNKAYENTFPYKSQLIPKKKSETNQQQSQTQQDVDWQAIKNCLSSAMKNDGSPNEIKLSALVAYLEKIPSSEWDWEQVINKNIINNSTTPSGASYKALLAILGYEKVQDWLKWLGSGYNSTYQATSLTIQAELLRVSDSKENKTSYEYLENRICKSMIELVSQCKSKTTPENQVQNIEWLLLNSHSLLSPDLIDYSWPSYYHKKLSMPQTQNTKNKQNKPKSSNRRQNLKFPLPAGNKKLWIILVITFVVIVGSALGMSLGSWQKFHAQRSDEGGNSGKNNFIFGSTLERDLYFWERTGDKQAKERIKNFLAEKDLDKAMATNTYIKNSLTPTISLSKEPTNDNPIKSGSSPEDINIIQKILKSLKYQYSGGERSFYEGTITGKFDDIVPAINQFQSLEMELPQATGVVASKTWQALKESFKNEQVKETKEFLLNSFQTRPNDKNIKKDLSELLKCKEKGAIDYIDCVNKLMPPPTLSPKPSETSSPNSEKQ